MKGHPKERPSSGKILIVDDDYILRRLYQDVLQLHGFEVDAVCNGQECLDYFFENELPALVLLDLMMPVMSGQELLQRIRRHEHFSRVPLVVLSSIADLMTSDLYGYPCVTKPLGLQSLVELARQYCGERSAAATELHK